MWFYGLLVSVSLFMSLRAALVVAGLYKDPVLASFEIYGEEKIYSPLLWLFIWGVLTAYLSLFLFLDAPIVFTLGLVTSLPLSMLRGYAEELVDARAKFFRRFPKWYHTLAARTSREERRRIAYLWLRLPARTRSLYNARHERFDQWVDLVLMTIAR